ncbi:hypothetical protein EVAR_37684_1 [Eumeta japonica]|uniref:Uncharacterized protein n=1 Tax=Eumeta variegata TaxID=151549 RepID=A0A4C1XUZ2_EUMVA|nr:hypothetical protein EVAR_37684_1 [Eumeta japonica]
MGLCRLEFLWPPPSSIIRHWIPSSDKVLVKRNHKSLNSMGLCRFITEFQWLPYNSFHQTISSKYKILVKTNDTSPNSMGCRFIMEFLCLTSQLHHQTLDTI